MVRPMRIGLALLASLLLTGGLVGCSGKSNEIEPPVDRVAQGTGYDWSADAHLLRKTYNVNLNRPGESPLMASSAKAQNAADRIFTNVRFEGMTREQVLEVLGDPRTISDYARRDEHFAVDSLTYVFDSGHGGWQYTLRFESARVRQVERVPLE